MSDYVITPNLVANGTVYPATFVKGDTANDLYYLAAGLGDVPIGISGTYTDRLPVTGDAAQPEAVAAESGVIYGPGAGCLLTAGTGGWTAFAYLKPDASGNGIVANPGEVCGAMAFTVASVGEQRRVLVLAPGTRAPSPSANGVVTATVSATLTAGQSQSVVFVTGADKVITLPLAENYPAGLTFRVVSMNAGGSTGTTVAVQGTDKLYGNGFTAALGKGAVNTHATAVVGDSIAVVSNGTDWVITAVTGTWARVA